MKSPLVFSELRRIVVHIFHFQAISFTSGNRVFGPEPHSDRFANIVLNIYQNLRINCWLVRVS